MRFGLTTRMGFESSSFRQYGAVGLSRTLEAKADEQRKRTSR